MVPWEENKNININMLILGLLGSIFHIICQFDTLVMIILGMKLTIIQAKQGSRYVASKRHRRSHLKSDAQDQFRFERQK